MKFVFHDYEELAQFLGAKFVKVDDGYSDGHFQFSKGDRLNARMVKERMERYPSALAFKMMRDELAGMGVEWQHPYILPGREKS